MDIKNNLKKILNSLPQDVILVGVTKYSGLAEIQEAIDAGLKNIGENRVDSVEKIKDLDVKKHFIGNIQSNKIRLILDNFDVIESVGSLKHLRKINEFSKETKQVLLQLKISPDENKKGIKKEELSDILIESKKLKNIDVLGFMMIASKTDDQNIIRKEFRWAKQIFDMYKLEYGLRYLSMGMSNDYLIAIEEGSNMVRVGSKIFK